MRCLRSCCKLVARWQAFHKQAPPGTTGMICLPENESEPEPICSDRFQTICVKQLDNRFNLKKKKEKPCKDELNYVNSIVAFL